jgi:alpha-D-ribose 1-methylphosphonate 5-triphosphate diphosphatase PhnM
MSEEEFMEYYAKKASMHKSSVNEEIAKAFEKQQRIVANRTSIRHLCTRGSGVMRQQM